MNLPSRFTAMPNKTACLLPELISLAFDDLGMTQQLYAQLRGAREAACRKAPPPMWFQSTLGRMRCG